MRTGHFTKVHLINIQISCQIYIFYINLLINNMLELINHLKTYVEYFFLVNFEHKYGSLEPILIYNYDHVIFFTEIFK